MMLETISLWNFLNFEAISPGKSQLKGSYSLAIFSYASKFSENSLSKPLNASKITETSSILHQTLLVTHVFSPPGIGFVGFIFVPPIAKNLTSSF